MSVIEINKDPDQKQLRWFGVLLLLFFGIIGAITYFRFDATKAGIGLWSFGVLVATVYYLVPPLRVRIYLAWMYAAFPIGWTISHLVLAAVFYLVVTPIGVIKRLAGYDPMKKGARSKAESYWITRRQVEDTGRYFRQF